MSTGGGVLNLCLRSNEWVSHGGYTFVIKERSGADQRTFVFPSRRLHSEQSGVAYTADGTRRARPRPSVSVEHQRQFLGVRSRQQPLLGDRFKHGTQRETDSRWRFQYDLQWNT